MACPSYEGAQNKQRHQSAKRLLEMLPNTVSEEEIRTLAGQWQKVASEAKLAGNYAKCKKKLQKAKRLLNGWQLASVDVNSGLASVLSSLGERGEAIRLLQQSLTLANPDLEVAQQLSMALLEVQVQGGMQEAVQ